MAKSTEFIVSRPLRQTPSTVKNKDVQKLQKLLIARGYGCGRSGADGIFGKDTKNAVRAFQGSERLIVDGIAGQQTIIALGGTMKE